MRSTSKSCIKIIVFPSLGQLVILVIISRDRYVFSVHKSGIKTIYTCIPKLLLYIVSKYFKIIFVLKICNYYMSIERKFRIINYKIVF